MQEFDVAAGRPSGEVGRLWNTCPWQSSESWAGDREGSHCHVGGTDSLSMGVISLGNFAKR